MTLELRRYAKKEGFPWLIKGSGNGKNSVFFIKDFVSEHTCGASAVTRTNPRLNSQLIAEICLEVMRNSETYSATNLRDDIAREYGFDITYTKAWRAVKKANESHFVYASINRFQHCRPMLFYDSTFLKDKYKGQMFAATAKDGNQQLFQVAFAIVNSENNENWEWFFRHLNVVLNPSRIVTFISDRHSVLLHGVSTVFSFSPHGFCTEHLKNNLRTFFNGTSSEFKDAVKKLFNKVIFATTPFYSNEKLHKLKLMGVPSLSTFLDGVDPKHYSDAYFEGQHYGEFISNAVESLNSKYRQERELPLLGLVDVIRVQIMSDMSLKNNLASKWKFDSCPFVDKELCEVRAKRAVSVDLNNRSCTCLKWQIHNMPCAHAPAAVLKSGLHVVQFIDSYYLTANYRMIYALSVFSVPTLYQKLTTTTARVDPQF